MKDKTLEYAKKYGVIAAAVYEERASDDHTQVELLFEWERVCRLLSKRKYEINRMQRFSKTITAIINALEENGEEAEL